MFGRQISQVCESPCLWLKVYSGKVPEHELAKFKHFSILWTCIAKKFYQFIFISAMIGLLVSIVLWYAVDFIYLFTNLLVEKGSIYPRTAVLFLQLLLYTTVQPPVFYCYVTCFSTVRLPVFLKF